MDVTSYPHARVPLSKRGRASELFCTSEVTSFWLKTKKGRSARGGYCGLKKVEILLSTYNGEKYLREQLDSFTALENYDDVKVLIRDDGSTDSTREILTEYRDKYGFDILFGENVGLNRSLHALMLAADKNVEYFAFSDQDDVWLPNKLSRALTHLSAMGSDAPALYCACSTLTDGELNPSGHTLIPKKSLSFYNAMVQNVAIGHTQVFNRALLELLCREYSDDIVITDHWAYLLASTAGSVVYDSEQTTLYRQHGSNVIGYGNSFFATLKTRIRRVFAGKPQENTRQLTAFLKCYGADMTPEHRYELEKFLSSQKNVFKRMAYLFRTRLYRQTGVESLIFRMMYLFGKYKIKNIKETSK